MRPPNRMHGLAWPDGDLDTMESFTASLDRLAAELRSTRRPAPRWSGAAAQSATRAVAHMAAMRDKTASDIETVVSVARRLSDQTRLARGLVSSRCLLLDDLADTSPAGLERYETERRRAERVCADHLAAVEATDRSLAAAMESAFTTADSPWVNGGAANELDRLYSANLGVVGRYAEIDLTKRIKRLNGFALQFPVLAGVIAPVLTLLVAQRAMLRRWVSEGRQFLSIDFTSDFAGDFAGDGRLVEVVGDLAAASSVIVVVPGVGNSLWTHDFRLGSASRNLAAATDNSVAVVAWLGYDTPGSAPLGAGFFDIAAINSERAETGGEALAGFVDHLATITTADVTVVGHSYGSVVAALAATSTKGIQDLVLLGSPGVPPQRDRLEVERVWASTVPSDLIDSLASLTVPEKQVDDDDQPIRLHHGWNPVNDAYGSIEITLPDRGHGGYFLPASAAVITAIATGDHDLIPQVGASDVLVGQSIVSSTSDLLEWDKLFEDPDRGFDPYSDEGESPTG